MSGDFAGMAAVTGARAGHQPQPFTGGKRGAGVRQLHCHTLYGRNHRRTTGEGLRHEQDGLVSAFSTGHGQDCAAICGGTADSGGGAAGWRDGFEHYRDRRAGGLSGIFHILSELYANYSVYAFGISGIVRVSAKGTFAKVLQGGGNAVPRKKD